MSTESLDIIVAGDLFADLIMSGFPAWPRPGEEAYASGFRREIGGGAVVTACGLAKLGSRAAVLSVLGNDGEWIVEKLRNLGIVTSRLCKEPFDLTGVTVAISTPEDRTLLTWFGANRSLPEKLWQAAADSETLRQARHVHLACAPSLDTATELISMIRAGGCSISLDVGWHPAWLEDPRARPLLRLIDIFFPNLPEARQMTGESDPERCLRAFEAAGARGVALKTGAEGAALLWNGEIFHTKPHPVHPLDTVGAGDCFDAGFLHFWLKGASPLTCLRAGNFCGAASTEAYGGIAGFPELSRLEQALSYA